LEGSGKQVRRITFTDAAVLERDEVQRLVDEALAHAPVPIDAGGDGRLIVRSVSAKQRPRRPAT
jgi:hypothetical protein